MGPEGSLLAFVVIALMWVAFDRMYPKAESRVGPDTHVRVGE